MKKYRIVSVILTAFMLVQMLSLTVAADAKNEYAAVTEAVPDGNMFVGGALDSASDAENWSANGQKMRVVEKDNGGYLECSGITVNHTGFVYSAPTEVPAGLYKFTAYIRTLYEGELTWLRMVLYDTAGNTTVYAYPTSDNWLKIETYITFKGNFTGMKVMGGPIADLVQSYCLDNISLVKVDSVPAGASVSTTFGTPVGMDEILASNNGSIPIIPAWDREAESKYEVNGIVINQDADAFIASCTAVTTYEELAGFARAFEGSHVTDYMICLNNTNATFPSETWTDLAEKYHQTVENGEPVNYKDAAIAKGAHELFEVAGLDYIDIWCDVFPEVGINPWLSFRMNDAHDLSLKTSVLLSDFYHENPDLRRVQSGLKNNTYYSYCMDYSKELVRDHMLDLIDEALSRYDCYGIELDFQREIWLWDNGSEYAGIDILNEFMRDVEAVTEKYEAKYGHEIKIGVRCASDITANYDFGLDIVTWAKEGILDMVSPCGRYSTTDNGIPVKAWCDILEPYGVSVWPGIETNIIAAGGNPVKAHSFDTMTAAAASYLSQGAEKVYLFNYYRGLGTVPTEKDRASTLDTEMANGLGIRSNRGYWNVITTVGSYEKLMNTDRRMILTYNDTEELWQPNDLQLPRVALKENDVVLHIPVGDIPVGSDVALKFGVDAVPGNNALPTVYVNGEKCEYIGIEDCVGGYTDSKLLCYAVPEAAHDEMYVSAEIKSDNKLTVNYAEVYITAPDNATAPAKAETTPSDWAASEVSAALDAGIVTGILRRDYTDKITRSEFCTLIMTMINKVSGVESSRELLTKLGIEYVDSFTDTDSADVIAANLMGIVNGRGNGIFDPFSGITRQEAAKMLANAAAVLKVRGGEAPEFADMDKAADWAKDSIKATVSIVSASGKNIMGGVGANRFDPLGAYTREQSVLTVYRLYDSIKGEADLDVVKIEAVPAIETESPSPAKIKPEGTSGIVIRANSDEVSTDRLFDTDVTDVVLTLGKNDPASLIKALRSKGIRVYVSVPADNAVSLAAAVLDKYNVDGIEVDFICGDLYERAMDDSYGALDKNTDMLASLSAKLTAYAAKYGHSIKVSVKVASDVMNSYYLGLNVSDWALKGLVDRVSPASVTVSDTDMHTRLWHSILEGYGVELVPVIGDKISAAKGEKLYDHTPETLASEALVMLSQGASKVSVSYAVIDDASLNVIGTYDKLIKSERRAAITYSDADIPWLPTDAQVPLIIKQHSVKTAKVNIGDVAEGQTVTVRIAVDGMIAPSDGEFQVYANSERCTYNGREQTADPMTGYKFCTYTVPAEVIGEGQLVLELVRSYGNMGIKYIEVLIK